MSKQLYSEKEAGYFLHARREILPYLPPTAGRVFEVGCGTGETLALLKHENRCTWAGGIELFPAAAAKAGEKADFVLEGNIEACELPLEAGSVDLLLCLDVLEHLVDPWLVLHRLNTLVKPGGSLICTLPNVRHLKVVLPLIISGTWNYTDYGILDHTHLRFFTRQSAIELVEEAGFQVEKIGTTGLEKNSKAYFLNLMSLSLLRPFLEFQFIIKAVKAV